MLNKAQIEKLKSKLEREKKDLEKQILELEKPVDFGSESDHFEEEADEAEEFGKNLGMAETFKARLNDVGHALGKIAKGGYGKCEKCGGEVELDVLNIDPESRYCKQCKLKQ